MEYIGASGTRAGGGWGSGGTRQGGGIGSGGHRGGGRIGGESRGGGVGGGGTRTGTGAVGSGGRGPGGIGGGNRACGASTSWPAGVRLGGLVVLSAGVFGSGGTRTGPGWGSGGGALLAVAG